MSQQTIVSPAAFYESYLVRYQFKPWSLDLLERARPQPGERVLDLACGTGAVAREAVKRVSPSGSVVGVDVSPDMLRVAHEVVGTDNGRIEWQQASAESLPLPDASFDLALCQQGVQFFPDKQGALRELRRVLKPGGRVALSVWRGIEHNPVPEALSRAANGRLGAAILFTFGLAENGALARMLEEAGFDGVSVEAVEKTIRFPSADEFVDNVVRAAAGAITELRAMSDRDRAELAAAVRDEVGPTLRSYTRGGKLYSPLAVQVATARS